MEFHEAAHQGQAKACPSRILRPCAGLEPLEGNRLVLGRDADT
jgi:hypothetical protein